LATRHLRQDTSSSTPSNILLSPKCRISIPKVTFSNSRTRLLMVKPQHPNTNLPNSLRPTPPTHLTLLKDPPPVSHFTLSTRISRVQASTAFHLAHLVTRQTNLIGNRLNRVLLA
jgi:hypothetical protein